MTYPYHNAPGTHALVGRTIQTIKLSACKTILLFVTDAGNVVAECEADCCSITWIEHVELPAFGFPAAVFSVENIELPGSDNDHPEHDCLQVYGLKIQTNRGEIVIDFRNSSNGYYGGSLEWPDERNYKDHIESVYPHKRWEELK